MASRSTGTPVSLVASGVSVVRGPQEVLVDVDLTITDRSRLAVLGPNGVGKSTLLAALAGEVPLAAGEVTITPRTARVGLVRQQLDRPPDRSVRGFLADCSGVSASQSALDRSIEDLAAGRAGAEERYSDALAAWMDSGASDFDPRAENAVMALGSPPDLLNKPVRSLSGGEASRVGLASVLLSRFDIVLLDEPTNDLDRDGLDVLEAWTESFRGGVVMVSHDRQFLERTAAAVVEIDPHTHRSSVFHGGWEAFQRERETAQRRAEEEYRGFVAERRHLEAQVRRQREWSAKGVRRARTRPPDGDKIRRAHNISQAEKLLGKAGAAERSLDRLSAVERPWAGWELRFSIGTTERSGTVVATLDQASAERGDFHLGPLDLEIRWGERVELVGANGTGKSTVIEMLLGRLPVTTGHARLGRGVRVGELDQLRHRFEQADTTLLDVFEDLSGETTNAARSVLAKFGLDAERVQRAASSLSPGERTRAQLALFQIQGVNLLVLDEPTNHLDLEAIEQLESALTDFTGTLILVTHDRRFRDNIAIDRAVSVGAG